MRRGEREGHTEGIGMEKEMKEQEEEKEQSRVLMLTQTETWCCWVLITLSLYPSGHFHNVHLL